MKRILSWVIENTMIGASLVAFAAVAATAYQVGEIDAGAYESLTRIYRDGSPEARRYIEEAFEDGSVSRWHYVAIFREALDRGNVIRIGGNNSTIEAGRAELKKLISQEKLGG